MWVRFSLSHRRPSLAPITPINFTVFSIFGATRDHCLAKKLSNVVSCRIVLNNTCNRKYSSFPNTKARCFSGWQTPTTKYTPETSTSTRKGVSTSFVKPTHTIKKNRARHESPRNPKGRTSFRISRNTNFDRYSWLIVHKGRFWADFGQIWWCVLGDHP